MIAGAYKEDRNSELEITFTGVGGLDEANATKKVTQGSKIPFEPEDPHAGYLVWRTRKSGTSSIIRSRNGEGGGSKAKEQELEVKVHAL
ncbi:hypothetical protein TWF225_001039 [Orbilia oligospora]|nr:hypothetical protein TWF225_001039 [Orbilia oligospora]KAF3237867.1 hypothetical protein TWF128_000753 [Orbilia oligospora]KAF3238445.1 hypothetical protein TWF217_001718 [Orbilia oligospora]KAF3283020.1 hypothetical protein TWF132_010417 [Orbilia oligospora]